MRAPIHEKAAGRDLLMSLTDTLVERGEGMSNVTQAGIVTLLLENLLRAIHDVEPHTGHILRMTIIRQLMEMDL